MTESEVIDWFMRWAAEYVKFRHPRSWDRDQRIDAHPRWRVYKLCELLGSFTPEDLTLDALAALAATLKGRPTEDFPDWWPDADWAFERLRDRPLALAAWKSNWRGHRQDRGNGRLHRDKGTDPMYDPPYHKIGVPKGI
jgi:hypothetical protein